MINHDNTFYEKKLHKINAIYNSNNENFPFNLFFQEKKAKVLVL